jgi:valyl-tRNA synthetase
VRSDEMAKQVLLWVLSVSLRTLHPFMPFLTDELWEQLPHDADHKLALPIAEWPTDTEDKA